MMCRERKTFLQQRNAAVVLQAATRDWAVRRDMERQQSAATLIQSHFRRLLTQQRYLRMTHACIKLQAAFRRHMQCSRFNRMRNAALTIQGHYRYHALRQKTRNAFLAKKAAAVVIQREYRQHRERKARTVCAVTVFQAAVRGWLMRLHFARLWEAASTLQANVRGDTWFAGGMDG